MLPEIIGFWKRRCNYLGTGQARWWSERDRNHVRQLREGEADLQCTLTQRGRHRADVRRTALRAAGSWLREFTGASRSRGTSPAAAAWYSLLSRTGSAPPYRRRPRAPAPVLSLEQPDTPRSRARPAQ